MDSSAAQMNAPSKAKAPKASKPKDSNAPPKPKASKPKDPNAPSKPKAPKAKDANAPSKPKAKKAPKDAKGDVKKKVKAAKVVRAMSARKILRHPSSAWIFYGKSQPNASKNLGERSKVLAQQWKAMTKEEKAPYEKMHQEDKERFERDFAALPDEKNMPPAMKLAFHKSPRLRRARRRHMPKAALSPFMFFVQSERPAFCDAHPDVAFEDVGREMGKMWHAMTEEQRAPFVAKSLKDRERYKQDMAAHNAKVAAHAQ